MFSQDFPTLLDEYWDGPAFDVIEHHDLDLEYYPDWKGVWDNIEPDAAGRLGAFAQEGTGGLICVWTYDGQDVMEAPVVHLGSEGECVVLAANIGEFLAMNALGWGPFALADREESPWSDQPPHEEGLEFLAARGITPPESVPDAIRAATDSHPDFEEWVYARLTD